MINLLFLFLVALGLFLIFTGSVFFGIVLILVGIFAGGGTTIYRR